MLVKDIINKIESKEMTIKQLAESYGKSDRTIQSKIKKLGYEWDSKNVKYNYVGNDPEPLEVDFDSLFDSNSNASKRKAKSEIVKSKKEVSSTATTDNKLAKSNQKQSDFDMIDMLLANDTQSKRTYRGFYFDEDVLSIIDSVDKRKKSELVNQALRKVFKDKGLL